MAKVLVVDDERHICRIAQVNLERAGHTVEVAHSGAVALQAIEKSPPDAIFVDTIMPAMSGYDLVAELHKDPATREIPVVFLGWRCAEVAACATETLMLAESGRPYLIKPFNPAKLVEMVDRVVYPRGSGGSSGPIL